MSIPQYVTDFEAEMMTRHALRLVEQKTDQGF